MNRDDVAEVTALVKQSGTSFYHGMKILEPARRDAMYGVYAFCRLVDDIADDEAPLAEKRQRLAGWRSRVAAIYDGAADDAVTRILLDALQAYDLRQKDFIAVIDGMEMDAGAPIIAPAMPELDLYCDRVAAAVGRLSVRIFGDASESAQEVAYALGRALQLTNILRDVGEDAARGRLYLPREILTDSNVPLSPLPARNSQNLPVACGHVATLAERYFSQAETAMERCDAKAMRPARMMAASYRPLLNILRRRRFNYDNPRARLPKARKLLLAARLLLP